MRTICPMPNWRPGRIWRKPDARGVRSRHRVFRQSDIDEAFEAISIPGTTNRPHVHIRCSPPAVWLTGSRWRGRCNNRPNGR